MPAPNDRNARIALANGWTVKSRPALDLRGQPVIWKHVSAYKDAWYTPDGQYHGDMPRDFVGTLEGVAWMLQKLNTNTDDVWRWWYNKRYQEWWCTWAWQIPLAYRSPDDRPGDCVGDAYLSVFGKEATDAS